MLACAVVLGAQIFAHPAWQIWTQALTAGVMLYFAAKLALQLFASDALTIHRFNSLTI